MAGERGGERGAATVFACFAVLALVAVTASMLYLGAVVTARHRAQSAADLAALAAAEAAVDDTTSACPTAEVLASRNGVSVAGCTMEGADVIVRIRIEVGRFGAAQAAARAGPAETEEET